MPSQNTSMRRQSVLTFAFMTVAFLLSSTVAFATPSSATFTGTNSGFAAQNIQATCTGFDTMGLQPQTASATFTFANGRAQGRLNSRWPG